MLRDYSRLCHFVGRSVGWSHLPLTFVSIQLNPVLMDFKGLHQILSVIGGILLQPIKEIKRNKLKDYKFATIICGIPLVTGPLEPGSTVHEYVQQLRCIRHTMSCMQHRGVAYAT